MVTPQRGDIFWVNLEPTIGTEIRKKRPAVVVSNDAANVRYHQVTVVPLTSQQVATIEPFQAAVDRQYSGLHKDSKAVAEQVRTISRQRLGERVGHLDGETMQAIDAALRVHLDLM